MDSMAIAEVETAAEREDPCPAPAASSRRSRLRELLLFAGILVAVGVILVQIGHPGRVWEVASEAEWGWLVAALTLSLATNVTYAIALKGTVAMPIPLWPATEVQLAMSFSNLVIPVVGGSGLQIRFLQRQGADLPTAVAAGGVLSAAGTVLTQLPMFLLAMWLSPRPVEVGGFSAAGFLEMAALGVVAAVILVGASTLFPRLRQIALRFGRGAAVTFLAVVRTPRQLLLVVAGNALTGLLYASSLWLCLYAFGVTEPFVTIMAVNMGVSSVAALVPIPGAGSGAGAIGLAAALIGMGVHAQVAVSATLASQMIGSYIPALAGWIATRHLIAHRMV